jgi:hypothetical protein
MLQQVVTVLIVIGAAAYATWSLWLRRRWRARRGAAAMAGGAAAGEAGCGCGKDDGCH